jgi:asparagine synthase (glutamine-hydrolysing)
MCGIAGCYQQPDGAKLVDIMSDRIAHRGPDSSGTWSNAGSGPAVQFGFRRLSIIDLSAMADQPLRRDGMTLIYNGELYNYKELRTELAAQGVRFTTSSDTEVVLEAWRRWGPDALRRFRGMFAFAIFEDATGDLVLARDPFGIKTPYNLHRGSVAVFASELKALVAAAAARLRIEPGALVASMLYYWLPEQRCAIDGVRKLPPGSWARFRPGGQSSVQQYWQVADVAAAAAAEPPADLGAVIEEAVTAHLVSDVPVSSFLSGGLDSSIITVLAHRANPEIDAYTIAFRAQDQRLKRCPTTPRTPVRSPPGSVSRCTRSRSPPTSRGCCPAVDVLDEPIGDPAAINTLLMCEAARERGVKVVLSGMGADELFGGYRKHLACVLASKYSRLPGPARAAVAGGTGRLPVVAAGRGLRYARWAKRFLTFADLPEEPRFLRSTPYDATSSPACSARTWPGTWTRCWPSTPRSTTTTRCATRSTGCAWPTRGSSCPG